MNALGFDQNLPNGLVRIQNLRQSLRGQIAALDQNFAQPLVSLVIVELAFFIDDFDAQLGIVLDEYEDIPNGVLTLVGGQDEIPEDVAGLGLDFLKRGDGLGLGDHPAVTQLGQFDQQGIRTGAAQDDVPGDPEANAVGDLGRRRLAGGLSLRRDLHLGPFRGKQLPKSAHQLLAAILVDPLVLGGFKQAGDVIPGGQREVDQVLGHRNPAVTHLIENGFDLVREGGDVVETEHRARALDGVHGPENLGHQFGVVRRLLQLEQRRLQLAQKLAGLLPEHIFLVIGHCSTCLFGKNMHRATLGAPALPCPPCSTKPETALPFRTLFAPAMAGEPGGGHRARQLFAERFG